MNKTVSVNISGLMFVLDEEAFSRLSLYLRDLRSHFAGRDGEGDIVSDIESRIAELLQSRLNDQKEVIGLQDVDWVIGVLGQPWQMEEEPAEAQEEKAEEPKATTRRLYRDVARAKVGGVAAGLGHYFRVDPIVFRIIFVALLFIKGVGSLVYILLWAFIPAAPSHKVFDDGSEKRKTADGRPHRQLFRDPDNKRVAGVASGLGHFFNVDPLIFRLLFVILTFASGIGAIAYIVLWIVAPVARTTSDKLRMKGQPVNVENIERTIQEEVDRLGRKMSEMGAEAGQGLRNAGRQAGPALGSLVKAFARIVSIIVGILFFIIGFALLVVFSAFVSGWEGFTFFEDFEIPFALSDALSLVFTDPGLAQLAVISLGAFLLIPVIMLLYVSLRLVIGNSFQLPGLGNIAGVLWVLSIIGLGYSGYKLGSDFRETGKTELVNNEIVNKGKLVIIARDTNSGKGDPVLVFDNQRFMLEKKSGRTNFLIMPHLYIEKASVGEMPSMKVEAIAKGEEEDIARERSRGIEYPVEYRNDTLFLPVWLRFDASEGLRAHRINVRINLPDSSLVTFDPALADYFDNNPRSFWRSREFAGRSYLLTANGFEKNP